MLQRFTRWQEGDKLEKFKKVAKDKAEGKLEAESEGQKFFLKVYNNYACHVRVFFDQVLLLLMLRSNHSPRNLKLTLRELSIPMHHINAIHCGANLKPGKWSSCVKHS